MRVVVTGATGFIGTTLCAALAAERHEPLPLDLKIAGERLQFDGADAVVHLAPVTVALTEKVGRAAAAAGAQIVFMSSVKVHGEESDAALTELARIAPRSAYAESKARSEDALRAIAGLRLAVLRPPLVYGPGVKANFLALTRVLARGLPLPLGGVANRRSLLYVGNLASAVLRVMTSAHAAGRSYLVSDGPPVSTPELCCRLATALGRNARLFPVPVSLLELVPGAKRLTRSLEVDDAALRRELAWRAAFSLEQGLRATAEWYLTR